MIGGPIQQVGGGIEGLGDAVAGDHDHEDHNDVKAHSYRWPGTARVWQWYFILRRHDHILTRMTAHEITGRPLAESRHMLPCATS